MNLSQVEKDFLSFVEKGQTYLMHLSYKSLGMQGVHPQSFIDSLKEIFSQSTLIIPTHTWDKVNKDNNICDFDNEELICVGVVCRWWSKTEGVFRNIHPTHSVGIYGAKRKEYEEQCCILENTPCGIQSPYRKLVEDKGKILMVGVDFSRNTTIHGMEEWNSMGKRITRTTEKMYVTKGNQRYEFNMQRHDNANSDIFVKLEKISEDLGFMKRIRIGEADCMLVDAYGLYDLVSFCMRYNDNYFDRL